MRVITGQYKGRRLKTLEGLSVRPTSDRMRETIFNILAPRIEGARVADVCAGSGAVGIEAISRGAEYVAFVESSRKTASVIEENLQHCKIEEGFKVFVRDALQAMKYFSAEKQQFDIIYFDPPYESEIYSPVMWQIARGDLLKEDGVVLVEHRRQSPLAPNYDQLRPYREIVQGESCLTFYERDQGPETPTETPTEKEEDI